MLEVAASGDLTEAVDCISRGGIICYPTETFYALGVDPFNAAACERLKKLKGRPEEKQLPLIAGNLEIISLVARTEDPRFLRLATRFWPGPLTLVLPAKDRSEDSVAIRISSHPVARQLSILLAKPVISTSANRSGEPSIEDPAKLPADLKQGIDLLLNGGIATGGRPSTIVSLLSHPANIIREGAIPGEEVLALL